MRIEILRQVMISGEPALAGSYQEVSTGVANLLIGMGKAKAAPEKEVQPNPKPQSEPEPVIHRRGRKSAAQHTQTQED